MLKEWKRKRGKRKNVMQEEGNKRKWERTDPNKTDKNGKKKKQGRKMEICLESSIEEGVTQTNEVQLHGSKQKIKIQEPVWYWRTKKFIEWLVFYGWILNYEKKNKTATFLDVKVHKYTKYTIWPWIKIVYPKFNYRSYIPT